MTTAKHFFTNSTSSKCFHFRFLSNSAIVKKIDSSVYPIPVSLKLFRQGRLYDSALYCIPEYYRSQFNRGMIVIITYLSWMKSNTRKLSNTSVVIYQTSEIIARTYQISFSDISHFLLVIVDVVSVYISKQSICVL